MQDDLFQNDKDEVYNDDDFPDDNYDSGLSDDDFDDEALSDEEKEDEATYIDFDALRASVRAGMKKREESNKKEDVKASEAKDLDALRNKIKERGGQGKEKTVEIYM